MTDLLRKRRVFDRYPFVLIDVGCSGGIHDAWRAFGPSLVAHGYDPDIEACEKAQENEAFPNVRYHPRFVGLPESHPFVEQRRVDAARSTDTDFWVRVTAGHLARVRHLADAAASVRRADPSTLIGVDEVVRTERLSTVDFLKVDVDGPDLEVLESARDVFAERQVLGVGVEVNWYGSPNLTEHTFHNTDLFLRQQGYALFGVTVRPYSRIDLPAPFLFRMYAQTAWGQPYQGDAIYVRDLAAAFNRELADRYGDDKLLKLACLYELIGLPDCAAEVINTFESRLREFGETEPLLDALTPELGDRRVTYREYISTFRTNPELFLPPAEEPVRPNPLALGISRLRSAGHRVKHRLSGS